MRKGRNGLHVEGPYFHDLCKIRQTLYGDGQERVKPFEYNTSGLP